MMAFAPVDDGMRKAARQWRAAVARAPWKAAQRLHLQSIAIIQPIDMNEAGDANMCDGCPDMTVHRGELVWSCRLDELKRHGTFLTCTPKVAAEA